MLPQKVNKYAYTDNAAFGQGVASEMKQLAELVAAKFSHQQNLEETFGSDESDDSGELDGS